MLDEVDNIINLLKNYNFLGGSSNSLLNKFLYIPTRNELLNTESLDSFLQNGGKTFNQKIIKGLRYENNTDNDDNNNDSDDSNESEEMYGGKRNKPSQIDEFHQDAINYLKDDLQLSPLEARAYKSLAYRYIKENNLESTALERAKLMLSLIKSENFLTEFKDKLDETMKIIDSIDIKKGRISEESSEQKSENKSDEKIKKTKVKK